MGAVHLFQNILVYSIYVLQRRPEGVLFRIFFTAEGMHTFERDAKSSWWDGSARFYGTLYLGRQSDRAGQLLVTVERV